MTRARRTDPAIVRRRSPQEAPIGDLIVGRQRRRSTRAFHDCPPKQPHAFRDAMTFRQT
ncbi:hypothetical protein BUC_2066 [Burkholderia pseudomallei 576]|nr:hypothetical protein BUC_2066 [Burkholderia pseudomallei 576]